MAHDYYGPNSIAGCDEGGETHMFNLESRIIELPQISLAKRIWKKINPEYIPDGSKETSKYVCERCNLKQTRIRVLDKDIRRYGSHEYITMMCHVDHL